MRALLLALALAAVAPVGLALAQEHEAAGAEASAHEAHHGVDWVQIAAQGWALAVVIGLVLWKGRAPLAQYLVNRRRSVADALEEAQRLKDAAEAKAKEYRDRLAKLNAEMDALRAEMIRGGEAERDRIVAEAEAKAARMRRETEFIIEQQMKQLRIDLTREAVEAAVAAAREVLEKQASAADQERLAKLYVEQLARAGKETRA